MNNKKFFTERDEWSRSYAMVWVSGTTKEKLIEVASSYDDRDSCFFNGEEVDGGMLYFDLCVFDARTACDELSAQIPEAIFYSFVSWDENDFYASKGGQHYTGYSVKSEGAPFIDELGILEAFEDVEEFYELHFLHTFHWEFIVLDEDGKQLLDLGANDFSLEEVNAIWNKQ